MNKIIKFILVFVLAGAVGFGSVILVKKYIRKDTVKMALVEDVKEVPEVGDSDIVSGANGEKKSANIELTPEDSTTVLSSDKKTIRGFEKSEPTSPILLVEDVKVVPEVGDYYSVSGAKVKENSENIEFTLEDAFGHKYTSANGSFNHVEANETGEYNLVARDTNTGLSSDTKTIRGFNKKQPVANPLTEFELTEIIMTGDYDGNKSKLAGKLAKSISIKCSNSDYKPNTIQEVCMSVGLEGWNVKVVTLDYNVLSQVTKIYLEAQQ